MKTIDTYSYKLGAADCFCEMVQAGVKKIALAHPCDTREERDSFHEGYEKLCQEYDVKQVGDEDQIITDLFPVSMNKDRFNVIFYQDDAVLQEYLDLKEEKRQAQENRHLYPRKAAGHCLAVWEAAVLHRRGNSAAARMRTRRRSRKRYGNAVQSPASGARNN